MPDPISITDITHLVRTSPDISVISTSTGCGCGTPWIMRGWCGWYNHALKLWPHTDVTITNICLLRNIVRHETIYSCPSSMVYCSILILSGRAWLTAGLWLQCWWRDWWKAVTEMTECSLDRPAFSWLKVISIGYFLAVFRVSNHPSGWFPFRVLQFCGGWCKFFMCYSFPGEGYSH
jgi:hypothetical protein